MDEFWERAVETALDGKTDCASARSLTLDGAVKCVQGRLPPPSLLEKFENLEHLSIANVGVSSLEKFPRLQNLQKLILSDNRIAGGLEFLVEAGMESLRDLDLSNNRIQYLEDLTPLAQLKLVSLDLYECPVTRIKDYRSKVFGLIKSLKYLDKMDADENERPESDEEEEDEEDDEEDDPGSGEIDAEDRSGKMSNGGNVGGGRTLVDVDEDEESDADEEETEITRVVNGYTGSSHHQSNGYRVAAATVGDEEDVEDVEDEEEDDMGEEIDEEEGEDEDVIEVHEIEDTDDEEDGVEEEDDVEDEDDEEDVEDEEEDAEPGSTGRLTSTEGEIDGHEQGEEDENGEIGEEEEQGVEVDGEYEEDDGEDEEEDYGAEFLVQPIRQAEEIAGGSDLETGNEEDDAEEEVEDEEDLRGNVRPNPSTSSQGKGKGKRKRDYDEDDDEDDDDGVEDFKSSRHH